MLIDINVLQNYLQVTRKELNKENLEDIAKEASEWASKNNSERYTCYFTDYVFESEGSFTHIGTYKELKRYVQAVNKKNTNDLELEITKVTDKDNNIIFTNNEWFK